MIIKKIRKEHERPEEGDYLAVLAYIEDLGKKNTLYGERDQVRFWWVLQQLGKDGKELVVISTYNKSLDEKANLTQAITDITGTPPGDEFDTESLIGINSRLTLKDKKKPDGHVYTDIVAILRPRKGDPVLPIPDWFKSHWDNKNTALSAAARPAPRAAVTPLPYSYPDRAAASC